MVQNIETSKEHALKNFHEARPPQLPCSLGTGRFIDRGGRQGALGDPPITAIFTYIRVLSGVNGGK